MKNVLLIVVLLLTGKINAQVEVSAGTGVGWFSMQDFHEFQDKTQSSLPVDAKITEQFPAYVIYEASLLWRVYRNGFIGLYYQYGSTGGRVHYKDYSGEIHSDQLLHFNTLALNAGEGLSFRNNFFMRIDLHPGVTFTSLELINVTNVGDQRYRESYRFQSINATVQPTVELDKTWGDFGVKLWAGYHFGVYAGKLKFKENKNSYLVGTNNDKIIASWDGLRLGLSATYTIGRRATEQE